jgi:hypothetical protein
MVGLILMIPVVAYFIYLIPSDRCGQLLVSGHYPGPIIMSSLIPPITLKEVVSTGNQNQVMGHINSHVKSQGWRHQKERGSMENNSGHFPGRWRCRRSQVDIDVEVGFRKGT